MELLPETFLPRHYSFSEGGNKNLALDGSTDTALVEHFLNVLDVLVHVVGPIVGFHLRVSLI